MMWPMAFRGIAIFPALVLLASCGSATLKNPDGSAGNGGASGGGGLGGAGAAGGSGGTASGGTGGGGAGKSGAGGAAAGGGTAGGSGGTAGGGGGGGGGGAGGAGVCTPGAKQCSGQQPQTCDTNGTWQSSGAACGTCMACSAATATCMAVANGTSCNDGNACTQTDTCQSGTCTGSNPVTCAAPTACHTAGTCNSSTGVCSTPTAPDSTSCTSSLYGSCQSGACACYQGVSPVACTKGASCMNWGFESGTAEGWGMDPLNPGLGVTNITVSSSHFHTGSHSLAVTMAIAAYSTNDARGISVAVPLCASSGTANLAGYTFSAWVYFVVTAGSMPMNAANLIQGVFYTPTNTGSSGLDNAIFVGQSTINQWLNLQGNLIQSDPGNYQLSITAEFPIANPNSEGFTGTMYLDDVRISPP